MNTDRLLRLATLLDARHATAKQPEYSQSCFTYQCGAPACALGHWAIENKERWKLKLRGPFRSYPDLYYKQGNKLIHPMLGAELEFDLSENDVDELFGCTGCGNAQSAAEAAAYIRDFVRRQKEPRLGLHLEERTPQ